jgi:hypothetical protein
LSPDAVGRNGRNTLDGRGVDDPPDPANNASGKTPDRAGNADKR